MLTDMIGTTAIRRMTASALARPKSLKLKYCW